jgi:hypothetical protein
MAGGLSAYKTVSRKRSLAGGGNASLEKRGFLFYCINDNIKSVSYMQFYEKPCKSL